MPSESKRNGRNGVEEVLAKLRGNALKSVDSKELASCLIQQFGGAAGLAKEVFALYQHPDTQAMTKSRLLIQAMSLVEHITDKNPPVDEAESVPEQEMEQTIKTMWKRLNGQ